MEGTRSTSKRVSLLAAGGTVMIMLFVLLGGTRVSARIRPCTAALTPDSIAAGSSAVSVGYSFSEDIGRVSAIQPAEDSGLRIDRVDAENSLFTLDATSASAGSWELRFMGEADQICSGTLRVISARVDSR